jgi:aminodeoxyfutalosine synthase
VNINLAIAERARAGEALTVAEIDELGSSDILSLGMLADEVRRARVGEAVTYSRVIELAAGALDAPGALGASGASGAEMRIAGLPATLEDTEGFIAEAPVDQLRDAEDALGACLDAGLPVRCLSLQSPIERDGRSSWLIHLRDLLKKFPLIDTVNPLSREQSITVPTTGYEDVRAVALARLVLSVKNIQVDWAQYGPKLAQVALTFGANDLDRVSTTDDASLGKRRTSVEDVRRNITAAGFTPIERTL